MKRKTKRVKIVTFGEGGYCAEVYTDDDDGSGFGTNPRIGYWFGSRDECEAIDPGEVDLYPVDYSDRPDFFDLACERRWD